MFRVAIEVADSAETLRQSVGETSMMITGMILESMSGQGLTSEDGQ